MAGEIWRSGRVFDSQNEGTGGGECPAEEGVRRGASQGRHPDGAGSGVGQDLHTPREHARADNKKVS